MKILMWLGGVALGGFVLIMLIGSFDEKTDTRGPPSHDEMKSAVEKIFATCDQRILGRQQAQGERISSAQASAITHCVDEMAGAYVAGANSGRR